uniref:Uncharacterized protein n=1 Tax=Vespula pensylvanica TaxID=30213 RepID=A0A834JLV4_VESPE|nr:hypothetical protein H0235_017741 [Vespula pensylvanica]
MECKSSLEPCTLACKQSDTLPNLLGHVVSVALALLTGSQAGKEKHEMNIQKLLVCNFEIHPGGNIRERVNERTNEGTSEQYALLLPVEEGVEVSIKQQREDVGSRRVVEIVRARLEKFGHFPSTQGGKIGYFAGYKEARRQLPPFDGLLPPLSPPFSLTLATTSIVLEPKPRPVIKHSSSLLDGDSRASPLY